MGIAQDAAASVSNLFPAPAQKLRSRDVALWLLAMLPIALTLYASLHHLKYSWDDGSITAAFARTWAESGRIALTPGSVVVEGYSSLLWFLLLSVPYFFTHNPDAGLIWMKILAAGMALLSLRLVYVIARQQFASRVAQMVAVLLVAFASTLLHEIENGMEMNLASLLLLLLFFILTREQERSRVLLASLVGCLLLLTRFESPFQLGLLLVGLVFGLSRRSVGGKVRPVGATVRDLWLTALSLVLFFLLVELWRYHVFSEWMPNTIYAKRFPPYRDASHLVPLLHSHWVAFYEPLHVLGLPLVVAFGAGVYGLSRRIAFFAALRRIHPSIWTLAAGCFLFGAMFGRNWGYAGRMVGAMIPFLVLAIVGVCVAAFQSPQRLATVLALLVILQGSVWLEDVVRPSPSPVSIQSVEGVGIGADVIRSALHQVTVTIMLPDIGGSSLCCEKLKIIDAGLLANPTLARVGWNELPEFFRMHRPDIVETHEPWAQVANFYDSGLLDDYSIVAANGIRFFVRNDLYRKLAMERPDAVLPVESAPACMATDQVDVGFSLKKQTCLVIGDPHRVNNY